METILGQLHKALETKARDSKYFHDYSNIVKEIIGDPHSLEKNVLELVQAEIMVFQFVIRRNELTPMFFLD